MKHLYCALLLALASLGPLAGHAQPASPGPLDSLRQDLDHLFAPLDLAQVPAPYLDSYALPLLPLRPYNGTLSDTCLLTLPQWRQLYATVFSSQVQAVPTASLLPRLGPLNDEVAQRLAAGPAIPLLVQRLDYAALRPDALTAGLLRYSGGQLHDVPGRPQSPYLARTLFAVAPGTDVSATGAVSFVFAPGLHVQRGGGSVRTLSLDFGDGRGYRPAAWNQPIGTTYCAAGTYRVKVRITYNSSTPGPVDSRHRASRGFVPAGPSSYESWFDLRVLADGCSAARYEDYQRIKWFPATSAHSGAYVYIRYGGTTAADTVLDKPFIVAEGYDPYHAAPALGPNLDVDYFLQSIKANGFAGTNLYNWLEHGHPGASSDSNYDILYIDYTNGTDDIRRNAALFEEVVRWVNANKVARPTGVREQNVVMGISMGGLVARYGLAEMVKNPQLPNNNPDTRLLITHDSPHHGANTPLGVQALTRQVNATLLAISIRTVFSPASYYITGHEILPELAQADKLLDEPASRQLLRVRMTRSGAGFLASYGTEYNSFIEGEYRDMVSPPRGQSFPYRFIATSLGSQCGRELFAPYTELVRIETDGFFTVVPRSSALSLHTQVVVNAVPEAGQVRRISGLRIWSEVNVLGAALFRHYFANTDVQSPASNPFALDGLPGGTRPLANTKVQPGAGGGDLFGLGVLYGNYSIGLQRSFCFVPTASALDVATFDNTAIRAAYINNFAPTGNRPQPIAFIAQAYDGSLPPAQQYNRTHPTFPARQAQWLYDQMEGLPLAGDYCSSECPAPLSATPITGPRTLCVVGNKPPATYTSPLQAPGYTYAWSFPASDCNLVTVCSGTGPTFQTANATNSGQTTLLLAVTTPCRTYTYELPLHIGAPPVPEFDGPTSLSCGATQELYTITNFDPSLSYSASVGGAFYGIKSFDKATGLIKVLINGTGPATLTVTYYNDCSQPTDVTLPVTVNACNSYTVHPNPADDQATVLQAEDADARHAARPGAEAASSSSVSSPASGGFTVRVYDSYGTLWHTATTGGLQVQLPTAALPAGLYVLAITEAGTGTVVRRQLQVTRR